MTIGTLLVLVGTLLQVPPFDCLNPWEPWDPAARFVAGRFYMNPYTDVIEALAESCQALAQGTCLKPTIAVRNVQGRAVKGPPSKSVVYAQGMFLRHADGEWPADLTVDTGKWGLIPEGCGYRPSQVAAVSFGKLIVR